MSFFGDLRGSLAGGRFYAQAFDYPPKRCWAYYLRVLLLSALLSAAATGLRFLAVYNDFVNYLRQSGTPMHFVNGRIVNLADLVPHKEFRTWSIHADTLYLDTISVRKAAEVLPAGKPAVLVGPRAAFLSRAEGAISFQFPPSMTMTVSSASLSAVRHVVWLVFFMLALVLYAIGALLGSMAMVLLVGLMVAFKFRSLGLRYGKAFNLSLYLVTFQLVASALLTVSGVRLPWFFLWLILFYIIYVGIFLNIHAEPRSPARVA